MKNENTWKNGFYEYMKNTPQNSLPTEVIDVIDPFTLCVSISFNKSGTLLALGCNDGRVILWDFITNSILRTKYGHVRPVKSLSWSSDDSLLCSGSMDRSAIVWDLIGDKQLRRCSNFNSFVNNVQFHPRNRNIVLMSMWHETPTLYYVQEDKYQNIFENDNFEHPNPCIGARSETTGFIAYFDKRGKYIYVGDPAGNVIIFNSENLNLLFVFTFEGLNGENSSDPFGTSDKITLLRNNKQYESYYRNINPKYSVRNLCFSKKVKKDMLLINSYDEYIRLYFVETIESLLLKRSPDYCKHPPVNTLDISKYQISLIQPHTKFSFKENTNGWSNCRFSNDGLYICAIANKVTLIIIWKLENQEPFKILSDSKSCYFTDIIWHPLYPIICCSSEGRCIIWGHRRNETWCNYEPNFHEVDNCVIYEEPEHEFDIEDEDNPHVHNKFSDILNIHKNDLDLFNECLQKPPYLSSDEEITQENLCFLPYHNSDLNKED